MTGFVAIGALMSLATSCSPQVEWRDTPPSQLLGTWIEQSDEVGAGLELADTVQVTSSTVILSEYYEDDSPHRTTCAPIRRVSNTSRTYVVFCGPTSESHIAETRLQFALNEGEYAGQISKVVPTGVNQDVGFFPLGHFVNRR